MELTKSALKKETWTFNVDVCKYTFHVSNIPNKQSNRQKNLFSASQFLTDQTQNRFLTYSFFQRYFFLMKLDLRVQKYVFYYLTEFQLK